VEFRILGPVELLSCGKNYKLGARKERGVLAVLLWELGYPIPAETLVSRIWGDDASDGAFESLYQNVSRLRKRLRNAGGTGRELPNRSGSYVLDVSRQDVDAWRFRALRDDARAAAAHGDDELAVTLFAEAEALWRGVPLDGLDGDWVEGIRARLNEERLHAAAHRIRAGLRLGRHADLVGEIADLAHQHPPNEALVELHLRALYGSGRQAEALSAYLQAERRWRNDFGGNLGPALRDLHQLMLHDDPALDG
jgi:DNA-binding SARP family transcriptional activator